MAPNAPGPPRTRDAVVLVPGIAGSELLDPNSRRPIWGLNLRLLERALLSGSVFDQLRRDDLVVGGLMRSRSLLPGLGRFDPYSRLERMLEGVVVHPDAFLAVPYDWRMRILTSSKMLADEAHDHLQAWRRHPEGSSDARLCFVAHSMGGLLSRHAANLHLDPADVSLIATMGTPFGGAARAAQVLAEGRFLPLGLQKSRVRGLARELPSLHDLLPVYPAQYAPTAGVPALDQLEHPGPDVNDYVAPSADVLVGLGAAEDLVRESMASRAKLDAAVRAHPEPLIAPLIGSAQPTLTTFAVRDGEVRFYDSIAGTAWGGDGTVYEGAAYPAGCEPRPLPQQHGPLAKSDEGLAWARATITHATLGPPHGDGIGLNAPDTVVAGKPFTVRILHERLPGVRLDCEESNGRRTRVGDLRRSGSESTADMTLSRAGLYTLTASGGGSSPVQIDVLAVDE